MISSTEEKVILSIDTSSNKVVCVGLTMGKKEDLIKMELLEKKAQVVLPIIEDLLKRNNLTSKNLTGIQVHLGPGSFTGLRVGVSIANSLGSYLKIPINGKPTGVLVEPIYT